MEGSTVFQSLNNVIYKRICLISTGNSKTLQTDVGNCSKAELLFIILYAHLPWFPLTNYYQEWGQHTYHYSFRIMDTIKSIFLSHLKVVFIQIGTQFVHIHLESSKICQIFSTHVSFLFNKDDSSAPAMPNMGRATCKLSFSSRSNLRRLWIQTSNRSTCTQESISVNMRLKVMTVMRPIWWMTPFI